MTETSDAFPLLVPGVRVRPRVPLAAKSGAGTLWTRFPNGGVTVRFDMSPHMETWVDADAMEPIPGDPTRHDWFEARGRTACRKCDKSLHHWATWGEPCPSSAELDEDTVSG